MEESFTARPLVGRLVALDVRPTRPLTLLGPAWAVICGALASGGTLLRGQSVLILILCLLLCDALLGAWRALWLQSDWRTALQRSSSSESLFLTAGDQGKGWRGRMLRLVRRVRFMHDVVWPIVDSEIMGMLIAGALAISIAILLGQVPLVLVILAMLFGVIEGQIGTQRGAGLRSVAEIALPWMIAVTAFSSFSWLSLVFALLFTLIYRALLGLAITRQMRWIKWANLAQLSVVLLLIASNAPAGAGVVLLGLLAQLLWQARYYSDHDGQAFARRVQSYVLVTFLIAGLSLWF